MGLAITVGIIDGLDEEGDAHHRAQLDRLAAVLAREGHPGWREPDHVDVTIAREHESSFPYSFLHYLRRAYALLVEGRPVTPAADAAALARDDGVVADAASMLSSHLLCHSDAEGYYVPVDLGEPLFVGDEDGIAGGIVGSSQRLLAELRRVGPAIGVRLDGEGRLDDAEAARLLAVEEGAPFWREQIVWLALHEACVASLATGAAIVFT